MISPLAIKMKVMFMYPGAQEGEIDLLPAGAGQLELVFCQR